MEIWDLVWGNGELASSKEISITLANGSRNGLGTGSDIGLGNGLGTNLGNGSENDFGNGLGL